MPIQVQCSQCGKEYKVGDDKAGRRFQCKVCQAAVVVPTPSAAADDPFGDMEDDFGEYASQPARPSGAKRSSSGKTGKGKKGKGKKSPSTSSGNGALLGIGIGAAVLILVAVGIFFFMRGGDDDAPAAANGAGAGGNSVASNKPGSDDATAHGGGQATSSVPGPMEGEATANRNTPADEPPRPTIAQLNETKRQLSDIARGMHNFHDVFGGMPVVDNVPAEWRDANGLPHLSWRVHLLPFLDQQNLYNQFHFDEPWDSPHNLSLIELMPAVYRTPGDDRTATTTRFVTFTGEGAPFGVNGPRMRDFQDGTSMTILVAHVNSLGGIPWTKPEDVVFDATNPFACIGGLPPDGLPVAMADGAVYFVNPTSDAETFSHLVQNADRQIIERDQVLLRDPAVASVAVPYTPPTTPPTGPLHLAYMTDDCVGLMRLSPKQLVETPWLTASMPPGFANDQLVPVELVEEAIFWIIPGPDGVETAPPDTQFALTFTEPLAPRNLVLAQQYHGQTYAHSPNTIVFGAPGRFEKMFSGSGATNQIASSLRADQMDADAYIAFQLQSDSFGADFSDIEPMLSIAGDLGQGLIQAEQVQFAFRSTDTPLLKLWITFPQSEMAQYFSAATEQQLPPLIQSLTENPSTANLATLLNDAWSVGVEESTVSLEIANSEELTTELASLISSFSQPIGMANPGGGSSRQQIKNQIRQILLAAHNYHDAYRSFPVARGNDDWIDENGKPFLSWRVHLLPYLGELDLYQEFHLDEPWDSEHNIQLLERMPDVFHIADEFATEVEPGMTRIIRDCGENTLINDQPTLFADGLGGSISDITDGSSNTAYCLVVGPEAAVPWTRPIDLTIDVTDTAMIRRLNLEESEGFYVGMCDGVVYYLPTSIDPLTMIKLIIHCDGEVVQLPEEVP